MKKRLKLIYVLSMITVIAIIIVLVYPKKRIKDNLNPFFERQIVSALDLNYINADSLYSGPFSRIFNDTIVGHWVNKSFDSSFYFVQSLKNPHYKKLIDDKGIIDPNNTGNPCAICVTDIDLYKDGALYFPRFGNNTMYKLSTDGALKEFFKRHQTALFYADKLLFYRNKTVIISKNGVYVFDIRSEKLLWKQAYDLNNSLGVVIDNKLIFTFNDEKDRNHLKAIIECIDLDNLTVSWTKEIKNTVVYDANLIDLNQYIFSNRNHEIVIPTLKTLLVFDLNNGVIKWQYDWNNPSFTCRPFALDYDQIYFSNGKALLCYNINNNSKTWQIDHASLNGVYKSNVVGHTDDYKSYIIIDKSNGKIKTKITNPFLKDINFQFINKYILINRTVLYK